MEAGKVRLVGCGLRKKRKIMNDYEKFLLRLVECVTGQRKGPPESTR